MGRYTSERESIVILRTRHKADVYAYFSSIERVVMTVLAVVTCTLGIVDICVSGVIIKLWKASSQSWPQFLLQFIGQSPDASHVYRVMLMDVFTFLLLLTAGACVLARRSIKELRGLVAYVHRQTTGSEPLSVREYIHCSSAPWLYPEMIEASSPTTVLDILQEHESTSEFWSKDLALYLEEKQREPPPAISMLISISEKVTISLIGQDGKRETVGFTHPQQAALIAFFAVQGRGMWIPRRHVIQQVYGAKGGHLFSLHTSRIHAAINQVARDAGFLSQEEGEAGQQAEKLKLFEFDDGGQEHVWRRVVSCEVEVLGDLTAFYERIQGEKDQHKAPGQEECRRACHQVMQNYGRGYLAEHQAPKTLWPWARESYIEYRDKCLYCLKYAAQREWAAAQNQRGNERYEAIRQCALFYGWFAVVASGIVPILRIEEAEEALCKSLKLYYLLKDIAAARAIFNTYAQHMKSKDFRWKPKLKMTEIWPEATAEE